MGKKVIHMDTFFERITFYDLYGYTIPGSFLILMLSSPHLSQIIRIWDQYENLAIYAFIVVVLLSFITGILISEIAHGLFYTILFILNLRFEHLQLDKLKLPESRVANALKCAGVLMDSYTISEQIQNNLSYIYGEIQADSKYKRIHNYASCEVLYRNMSMALSISILFIAYLSDLEAIQKIGISMLFIIGAFLMGSRAYRFMIKKESYAVYWFVEKYGNCEKIVDCQPK